VTWDIYFDDYFVMALPSRIKADSADEAISRFLHPHSLSLMAVPREAVGVWSVYVAGKCVGEFDGDSAFSALASFLQMTGRFNARPSSIKS